MLRVRLGPPAVKIDAIPVAAETVVADDMPLPLQPDGVAVIRARVVRVPLRVIAHELAIGNVEIAAFDLVFAG
jgi:hypothetical protein